MKTQALEATVDPLKRDFRNFLYVVWKYLNLPDPTRIQYDIALYLQHGPRRRIIEAFRGVGKSWITVAYVVWRLYCNPQMKIEVVSASKSLADNFSTFALQLLENMPMLSHLAPRPDQRKSMVQFDVGPAEPAKDPSIKSCGITGQITGTRADLLVADDIEVPNNSMTQDSRMKLAEAVKEFDAILKPGGEIVYLGTPQTEESIYNELPKRGYAARIWPARLPSDAVRAAYADRLAPIVEAMEGEVGDPVDPARFGRLDLEERELSYGKAGFSLQFMLDTSLSDADRYPLKLSDLMVMNIDESLAPENVVYASSPEYQIRDLPNVGFATDRYYRPWRTVGDTLPFTGSAMSIDPSGRGSDELSWAVGKMLNGIIYVPEVTGVQGGYSEANLKRIVESAKRHKVNKVVIESNFGDGMFTALIKPLFAMHYPVSIEEVRHSKQKESRIIDTLEPVLMRHKLVLDPEVIRADYRSAQIYPPEKQRQYMLMYQLSRITRDKGALGHDDRLDALAILVAYWVTALSADAERNMSSRQDDLREQALRSFVEGITGRRTSGSPLRNAGLDGRRGGKLR